jgi:tetratricopeptide (TPR) repeat protein
MHKPVALVWFTAIAWLPACEQVEGLRERFLGGDETSSPASSGLAAAVELYEAGDARAAAEQFEALVAAAPNEPDLFYRLGLCYLALAGDTANPASELTPEEQQSLDAFQTALTLNPRHAEASIGIGDLYARRVPVEQRRRRRSEQEQEAATLALEAYQRAVTIDPKQPEAQRRLALFLERLGQVEAAERAHQAAVAAAQANPDIAPMYYTAYGRFLASQSDRAEEAINQLELAQMVRGDDPQLREEIAELYSRIGHQYFEEKRYSLAEQTLTKAYRIFPDKSSPEAQKTSSTLNQLRAIRGR